MTPRDRERFKRAFCYEPCFKSWAGCGFACLCTRILGHDGPCACGKCWKHPLPSPDDRRTESKGKT